MKRLFAAVLVLVGSLATSGVALADHDDVSRPACADIHGWTVGYNPATGVTAQVSVGEAVTCRGVVYTLVVEVDPGEIITVSSRGDGTNNFVVLSTGEITTDSDGSVCIHATTSRGPNQIDRFPNSGCETVALFGGPGDIGHA